MKRTFLIFLVLVFSFELAQSQVSEPTPEPSQEKTYGYYIQKHHSQKVTGWVLLGTGVGMAIAGTAMVSQQSDKNGTEDVGTFLLVTGGATAIASIPVLISSGKNKKKATAIMEAGKVGIKGAAVNQPRYVSVGLRMEF